MLLLGVVASGLAAPAMPRQYMGSEDDMIDILTLYGPSQGSCLTFALEWGVVRDVWGECYERRRHVE